MTFNITNASLISSLSTFVAEAVAAERESNPLRITDSDIAAVKDAVLADIKIDAADVAEHIDTDRIVDALDVDTIKESIASQISPRMIAREIDSSDIADTIAQGLDLGEIAQNIDASDLAQYLDVDSSEIASNLYEDESFVEKVASKITYNLVDSHVANIALKAEVADAFAQQIDARITAACERLAEQVTQRVLAQIGSTLVALLTGGAKPQ